MTFGRTSRLAGAALAAAATLATGAGPVPRPAQPVEVTAVDTASVTLDPARSHGRLIRLPLGAVHLRALAYPAPAGALAPGEEGLWLGGQGGDGPHTLLLVPAARGRLVRRGDGWGIEAGRGPVLALDLSGAARAGLGDLKPGQAADAFGVRTGPRVVVTFLTAPPRETDTRVAAADKGRLVLKGGDGRSWTLNLAGQPPELAPELARLPAGQEVALLVNPADNTPLLAVPHPPWPQLGRRDAAWGPALP